MWAWCVCVCVVSVVTVSISSLDPGSLHLLFRYKKGEPVGATHRRKVDTGEILGRVHIFLERLLLRQLPKRVYIHTTDEVGFESGTKITTALNETICSSHLPHSSSLPRASDAYRKI